MEQNLFLGIDMKDRFDDFYPHYNETKLFSKVHPSLYMYTSFLGYIMYIKRNKFDHYEIHTRNWRPNACNSESKKMLHLDFVVFTGDWVRCLHHYYQLWSNEFRIVCHNALWNHFDYGFEQLELEFD